MILNGKVFKSFTTLDNVTVSENDLIEFSDTQGEVIQGEVVSISAKSLTIKRDEALNSENWEYLNIEEGTLKLQ